MIKSDSTLINDVDVYISLGFQHKFPPCSTVSVEPVCRRVVLVAPVGGGPREERVRGGPGRLATVPSSAERCPAN